MAEHKTTMPTPGPWEVRNETCIVSTAPPDPEDEYFYDHDDGDCRWVAETTTHYEGSDPYSLANARLISAAPEMLVALKLLLTLARSNALHKAGQSAALVKIHDGWVVAAESAITKATKDDG